MMDKKSSRKPLFALILGLVAVALVGAIWAWTSQGNCASCQGVRDLAKGISLAPVGAVYYAALLALGGIFGPSRFLFGGVLVAAAAHAALLLLIIQRGMFCAPCVVTGLAAIAAATLSFVVDPVNLARAGILLPVGAIGAHLALFWAGGIMAPSLASAEGGITEVRRGESQPPRAGVARVTVYSRRGCPYCIELEEKILPVLRREFGNRLDLHLEDAAAGMPTPTIVIAGAKGVVFPGLPPVKELRAAILDAIGGESHEPSVLSKP
jgi:hypothetical protein